MKQTTKQIAVVYQDCFLCGPKGEELEKYLINNTIDIVRYQRNRFYLALQLPRTFAAH